MGFHSRHPLELNQTKKQSEQVSYFSIQGNVAPFCRECAKIKIIPVLSNAINNYFVNNLGDHYQILLNFTCNNNDLVVTADFRLFLQDETDSTIGTLKLGHL